MNICKVCGKEHDGSYGSGVFCSDHCRRVWIGHCGIEKAKRDGTFSARMEAVRKNAPRRRKPYGTWKCEYCGFIAETRRDLDQHIIDAKHRTKNVGDLVNNKEWFDAFQKGAARGRAKNIERIRLKYEEIRRNTPTELLSDKQRKLKILEKFDYTCVICGQKNIWNGKPLNLQIHHLDGNHKNNKEENLISVCPNCHSQTENYMAKNKTAHVKFPSDDVVLEIWKSARSLKHCIELLGRSPTYQNYRKVREILDKNGIEYQLKNG